eukprot:gene9374-5165_t
MAGGESGPSHRESALIVEIVFVAMVLSFVGMRAVRKYELRWLPESGVTILVGFVIGSFIHFAVGGVYKAGSHD